MQDQRLVVLVQAGKNHFAEAAGADQPTQRGCADIDHGGGFDAGQDGARGHGQFDQTQPGQCRQSQGLGGFTQGKRYAAQAGVCVAHDRQEAIQEQGRDRGTEVGAQNRDQHGQQRNRWNRLQNARDRQNALPERRAVSGGDPQGDRHDDCRDQRQRHQHQVLPPQPDEPLGHAYDLDSLPLLSGDPIFVKQFFTFGNRVFRLNNSR